MLIELSETYTHVPCNANKEKLSGEELKNVLIKLMKENGIEGEGISIQEDGVLAVNETPNLKLHSLMLQAEELGLEMKCTKKTLIEFC